MPWSCSNRSLIRSGGPSVGCGTRLPGLLVVRVAAVLAGGRSFAAIGE